MSGRGEIIIPLLFLFFMYRVDPMKNNKMLLQFRRFERNALKKMQLHLVSFVCEKGVHEF